MRKNIKNVIVDNDDSTISKNHALIKKLKMIISKKC